MVFLPLRVLILLKKPCILFRMRWEGWYSDPYVTHLTGAIDGAADAGRSDSTVVRGCASKVHILGVMGEIRVIEQERVDANRDSTLDASGVVARAAHDDASRSSGRNGDSRGIVACASIRVDRRQQIGRCEV